MIAPCIICGTTLREVGSPSDNHPDGAVVAVIGGNYGSTVFDPFDGTHLEVNICDPCLVTAGADGRVLTGRCRKPVTMGGFRVGYEDVDTPLLPWTRALAGYGTELVLEPDEDLGALPTTVHIDARAWANALKFQDDDD